MRSRISNPAGITSHYHYLPFPACGGVVQLSPHFVNVLFFIKTRGVFLENLLMQKRSPAVFADIYLDGNSDAA